MRLLWFNLATDVDDPVLGFTSRWFQAIATKVERIHVITMRAGRIELPENVRCDSVGKEAGYSRPRRIVECYRILLEVLRNEPVDACFFRTCFHFSQFQRRPCSGPKAFRSSPGTRTRARPVRKRERSGKVES